MKDRHPGFAELPCQIAAVVPEGPKEQGCWQASDWLTRDVRLFLEPFLQERANRCTQEQRKSAKFAQYALAATQEALEDADWKPSTEEEQDVTVSNWLCVFDFGPFAHLLPAQGVCMGSGIGNFDEIYDTTLAYAKGVSQWIQPSAGTMIRTVFNELLYRATEKCLRYLSQSCLSTWVQGTFR